MLFVNMYEVIMCSYVSACGRARRKGHLLHSLTHIFDFGLSERR